MLKHITESGRELPANHLTCWVSPRCRSILYIEDTFCTVNQCLFCMCKIVNLPIVTCFARLMLFIPEFSLLQSSIGVKSSSDRQLQFFQIYMMQRVNLEKYEQSWKNHRMEFADLSAKSNNMRILRTGTGLRGHDTIVKSRNLSLLKRTFCQRSVMSEVASLNSRHDT